VVLAGNNGRRLRGVLLLLVFTGRAIAVAAGGAPDREPRQQVALCIARYLEADPATIAMRLEILNPLRVFPPNAGVHVVSARQEFVVGDWLLRIDCSSPQLCLPFVAILHAQGVDLGGLQWQRSSTIDESPSLRANGKQRQVAQSGEVVELVGEFAGISLRTRAVCLESGAMGQKIRVRNLASHRVLTAAVAGPGVVRLEQ